MRTSISVTSIVRRTFGTYFDQVPTLLSLAALAVVSIAALDTLPSMTSRPVGIIVLIVDIAVIGLFTGMVVRLAADLREGAHAQSAGQLLRAARSVLGQLVLVGIVAGIAIAFLFSAASLLFVVLVIGAIVGIGANIGGVITGLALGTFLFFGPGLFLLTTWSVAAPVVVLERPGGLLALPRSHSLVRGNRWRVLAAIVAISIPVSVAGSAIELAGQALGSWPAVAAKLLAAILTAPLPILAATALYFELRGSSAEATQPGPPTGVPSKPLPPAPAQDGAPTPPRA